MADNEQADGGAGTGPGGTQGGGAPGYGAPGYGGYGYGDPASTPVQGSPYPGAPGQGPVPDEPSVSSTSGLSVFGEGRYRLTHRLGRGGMAEVFAARDVRLGRTVAIKVLRPELAEDTTARIRFTREAHSVASLNHHAVVAVYDTGEEAQRGETVPYIVMELVEGHTVRELLQGDEPPPVSQALIITAGILEALAYSHRHGIVHRDIKPANVIITNTGAVKVMDFGIARALTGATSTMTQTGMVMGTPQYLSPEQALGKAVDHRSDLYATGCMLYELLTLRPPFTGDTPLSVVYQHVQDLPVPPSQANSRVPASLDALVLRSLAKEPDDRFQSADEFRAHLQHALRTLGSATGPTELLPSAAAAAMAPTVVGRTLGTPPMGTRAMPADPGSAVPPRHRDPNDGNGAGDGNRRTVFAVIAVLVAIAAITIGVVLANQGNSGSPGTSSSSSPAVTPSDTTASQSPTESTSPTASATPSTQPPTTPSFTGNRTTASSSASLSSSPSASISTSPSASASASSSASAPVSQSASGGASSTATGNSAGGQAGGPPSSSKSTPTS
ncbi:protein kinase [Streptacidiphilus sp. EB103A]|uniref:protein kinase domain-containing protein n=1 Tax=Streptacidiphilus sp. EB103A TaxID=3156275 RepID=UPI0035119F77